MKHRSASKDSSSCTGTGYQLPYPVRVLPEICETVDLIRGVSPVHVLSTVYRLSAPARSLGDDGGHSSGIAFLLRGTSPVRAQPPKPGVGHSPGSYRTSVSRELLSHAAAQEGVSKP